MAHPDSPLSRDEPDSSAPAPATPFVIIGADAYLAARPATRVQVAHACRAAGYAAAIPATWGDELIAAGCARRLARRTLPSAIFCSCRRVRDRLLGPGPDLLPFLVSFVAPPVATARYLRQLYGSAPLDITYVGACPSAADEPMIDRQIRPEAFFASIIARGIVPAQEPLVFNSFFAPDRRRCVSLPGGLPIDRVLQGADGPGVAAASELDDEALSLPVVPRSVVEVREVEYAAELAQYLIMSAPVLLDLAPRLGCFCSGAVGGVPVAQARAAVLALEPPRSPTPVVDTDVRVEVDLDPAADDSRGILLADVIVDRPADARPGTNPSPAAASPAADPARSHRAGGIAQRR
jgi:hypothetical protein